MLDKLVESRALKPGDKIDFPLDYIRNPETPSGMWISVVVAEKDTRLATIIDRVVAGLIVMAVYTIIQWLIGG